MSAAAEAETAVASQQDVFAIVRALKEASHNLQSAPHSSNNVETLARGLHRLQNQEFLQNASKLEDPSLRRKVASLCNLVTQLQPQVERARTLTSRSGIRYYLSRAKGMVLGNDITCIAHSMESELQTWLDRQEMEHLAQVVGTRSGEEEQVEALREFEAKVREGYSPELQESILAGRVFESLASALRLGKASPRVQREAAFALASLVHFNKDVFVSQVLMQGVVESLLSMVIHGSDDDLSVAAVCVLGSLIRAGKGAVVDEIHSKGGVKKIVNLLQDECEEWKIAAMECVLQMAYYGRKEAVEAMLEEDVVKKLADLQQSAEGGDLVALPLHSMHSSPPKDSSGIWTKISMENPASPPSATECSLPGISKDSPGKSMDFQDAASPSEVSVSCSGVAPGSPASFRKSAAQTQDFFPGLLESPKAVDERGPSVEDYLHEHPFASAVSRFAIQVDIGQGLSKREKRELKQEILKRVREALPSDAEVATIFAEVLWGP